MADPTRFEAVTGAIGQALALYGGARQTRLTAQSSPADQMFHVEHLEDWPNQGTVSVGGITYRYSHRTVDTLEGLRAVVGGTEVAGIVATHPQESGVLDLSQGYSELDALRGSLFLPTASGDDLAALGRGFGVPRDESLSGDEQYRQVIRAIAYAPATSLAALEQALDALLGAGAYSIEEDPIAHPGQVFITVDYAARRNVSPIGRAYISSLLAVTPETDGTLELPGDARAPTPLLLATYDVAQDCRMALPSASNGWRWQAATETTDCQLVPEGAQGTTSSLTNLTSAYRTTAPTLRPGASNRLGALVQVVNVAGLATSGAGCGASLADGERYVAWNLTGPTLQISLLGSGQQTLAGPVAVAPGYRHISLTLDGSGAVLRIDGVATLRAPRSSLSATASTAAFLGNLSGVTHPGSGGAPQLLVRWLGLYSRDSRDYSTARGTAATTASPSLLTTPGFDLTSASARGTIWVTGAKVASNGGTANGRYRVASTSGPNTAVLQGLPAEGGALVRAADGSSYLVAASDAPLMYPDDLGKTVVVTGPSLAGVSGSYTIQALYDPKSGKNLDGFATRLRQASYRAQLAGQQVLATDNVSYRVDPSFGADSVSWQLSLPSITSRSGNVLTMTPPQPLPLPQARYTVPYTTLLGCQMEPNADTSTVQTDPGPPPVYDRYPLYLTSPFEAVESYLPSLTAAGVQAVLRFR